MPSSSARYATPPRTNHWYLVGGIILALMLIISSVGLVLFQTTLKEDSQDLRQQAMVADGKIELSFNPTSSTSLIANQEHTIELKVNTHNYPINGIQLAFNVISSGLSATPELQVVSSNIQTLDQEVEQTNDGYLVSLTTSVPSGVQFATSQPVTFATLKVTPSQAGQLSFNFDPETSIVTIRNASPVVDELRTIASVSYPVTAATGGVVYPECNSSCSSNDDCAPNHRCYDTGSSDGKRCRLVTNVTSTSCAAPSLNRSCNEYCADSRECGSGLTCYFNRCRQPENVESATCQLSTEAQRRELTQSCNQGCSANRECPINMRCYNGSCRLATNPSSTSCTAATSKSVSSTIYQKGGTVGDQTDGQLGTDATTSADATTSGSILSPIGTDSAGLLLPSATPSAFPSPTPTLVDESDTTAQESMLATLIPKLLMGAGVLLLLIVLAFILSRLLRGRQRPPQSPPPAAKTESDTLYEQQLQEKISALQQEVRPATPPPITQPTTQPVFRPAPEPVVTQPMPAEIRPQPTTPQPSAPAETAVFDRTTQPARSSMMDRIRDKGIVPPGNGQDTT